MAQTLSNNFIASFETEVKQQYQNGSLLQGTVRTHNDVEGSTDRFHKMGKKDAVARGTASSDVVALDFPHTNATATLVDRIATEYCDVYDMEKINFDLKQELAQAVGNSLGRNMDALIIAAMATASSSPDHTIVHGSTGLTLVKLTKASKLLNKQGVPMSDRTLALSADGLEDAMNVPEITSADYATMRALMSGDVDTFMGFTWKMIEDRTLGGLAVDGTTRTCLAYHKASVGLAIGMEPRTEINYVAHKTSWLITGMLSAGATAIEDTGYVHLEITE